MVVTLTRSTKHVIETLRLKIPLLGVLVYLDEDNIDSFLMVLSSAGTLLFLPRTPLFIPIVMMDNVQYNHVGA